MSWRALLGRVSAGVVRAAERGSRVAARRALTLDERRLLTSVFGASLHLDPIELCEGVTGLVNLSRRAFVIEHTLYLPVGYLPLRPATLVHEATHVWQFQHGGHAYIGDSLHAQLVGEGYELVPALSAGRPWARLNCEQQASVIELGFEQGCLEGRPFVLEGRDFSAAFAQGHQALLRGEGAPR